MAAVVIMCLHPGNAAAEDGVPGSEAERLIGEGLQKILDALNLLLKTVPQYAAPEVLPNGDIIIRRLHPGDDGGPGDEGGPGDDGDEPRQQPAPEDDSAET
ncbi:MAG: hypothetical protein ACK4ZN_11400 [Oceanibaculum sp.]